MRRTVACAGTCFTIVYAVCSDHSSRAETFYNQLSEQEQAKINKLFQYMGDHGRISNTEKFKKIEGTSLFEFKGFRFVCRVTTCPAS